MAHVIRPNGNGWNLKQVIRMNRCSPVILISTNRCLSAKPSGGLADQLMKAKIEEEQKEKGGNQKKEGGEKEEAGKKYQPLTKWQKIGYWFFGITMIGGLGGNAILFSLPDRDEEGNNIDDEFTELPFPTQYYRRLKAKIFKTKKEMEDPFSDKLLPDPLPEPYHQPKYTILIELTGLLISSNWTHKHGWRFQKRPGVDIFLNQVGYPNFELVVFTTENGMTFHPITEKLDPENRLIMYKLYRDSTRFVDGQHKKDLSVLNRDLSKVILVDWNEKAVDCNRDNALVLKKWEGDNSDRSMIGLAQFLQAIQQSDVDDVREVLRHYQQFEDPIEAFREKQIQLQEELAFQEEKLKEQSKAVGGSSSLFSGLSAFRRR